MNEGIDNIPSRYEVCSVTLRLLIRYKEDNTCIKFRLIDRPEYFYEGKLYSIPTIEDYNTNSTIIFELLNGEKLYIPLFFISPTSIHPASINPIEYFKRNGFTEEQRGEIFNRCNNTCELKLEGCTSIATEIDHFIPVSKGGSDETSNGRAACFNCNRKKSNKFYEECQ